MSRMSDASILVEEILVVLARVDSLMANFVLIETEKHFNGTLCPNCGEYRPLDVEYMKVRSWCFTCNGKADEARGLSSTGANSENA